MHEKGTVRHPDAQESNVKPNRLYNSREARVLLGGISERTFRRLTKTGELRSRKQGTYVYVSQTDIDDYIAGLPSAAADDERVAA